MSTVNSMNSVTGAYTAANVTALDEQAFRRVFRFHPSAWRERNEAAAAGLLMDVAEAGGSSRVRLADRLSAYGHAASLWADRGINRQARETLASLALGTGIAMGVLHFLAFWVLPLGERFMFAQEHLGYQVPLEASISVAAVGGLWILAAIASAFRWRRGARQIALLILLACIATVATRYGIRRLGHESAFTPLIFGGWAALAVIGRPRIALVWKTAGVVAVLFGAALMNAQFGGWSIGSDVFLWRDMAPYMFLALLPLAAALLVLAACGRGNIALIGTLYTAPWVVLVLVGLAYGQMDYAFLGVIAAVWLCTSLAVLAITRFAGRGPIRARGR